MNGDTPDQKSPPQPAPQPKKGDWRSLLQQINLLLSPAKQIAIFLPADASLDPLAAGFALSKALNKIGRATYLLSPKTPASESITLPSGYPPKAPTPNFSEISDILTSIPSNTIELTIYYKEGSYSTGEMNVTSEELELKFVPPAGKTPVNPLHIKTRNEKVNIDALITLGIPDPAALTGLYTNNSSLFQKLPVLNLDIEPSNGRFGKVDLIDSKASSLSELITLFLHDLKVQLDAEIAAWLYAGILAKTENLSVDYRTPNLLEASSVCLRYLRLDRIQGAK